MSSGYRLYIDIEIDEAVTAIQAAAFCNLLMSDLKNNDRLMEFIAPYKISYRLGRDGTRAPTNYLDLNENGHPSTKKCVL
jgi:hypothetical protein